MEIDFLPVSQRDMQLRGWDYCDFIIVTGDAYVDHPSFGAAVIGRVLESRGFKVGVISQPDWRTLEDFKKLGKPRLGFLVTSGNIDSMVNHYTVTKNKRRFDAYSPGGKTGLRPNRATIVYAHKVRQAYKDAPIILGGIEASLRRLGHYDYWDDAVRRSIIMDAKADLVVYGMGENQIIEIAEALESGINIEHITWIRGTLYKTRNPGNIPNPVMLPPYDEIKSSKRQYAQSFMMQYRNTDAVTAQTLIESYGDMQVVQNPPAKPLTQDELDTVYYLPYTKEYHPVYNQAGGVPALKEVQYSLVSSRGCFGSCNFCALNFHQGRTVQSRSIASIVKEAEEMVKDEDFKGYIHDVGGPTANFRSKACQKQTEHGVCQDKQCLFPNPCANLEIDHSEYLELLRKLRQLPQVKKVFIRSGIRYDYLMHDPEHQTFMRELCLHHVSGQLKVAPEHISPRVLDKMGKPKRQVYEKFVRKFKKTNQQLGKEQYLIPYLISSHPGSDLDTAIELAEYLRDFGFIPEQVQDFYPTPGTMSTCMYYTELDPRTMTKVHVPKSPHEKAMQRALIHFNKRRNYELVYEALQKAGRQDLIGYQRQCLIKPKKHN